MWLMFPVCSNSFQIHALYASITVIAFPYYVVNIHRKYEDGSIIMSLNILTHTMLHKYIYLLFQQACLKHMGTESAGVGRK